MALQVYLCPTDGQFAVGMSVMVATVPQYQNCPTCHQPSRWQPSLPASITVIGGTGAGKGRR